MRIRGQLKSYCREKLYFHCHALIILRVPMRQPKTNTIQARPAVERDRRFAIIYQNLPMSDAGQTQQ